MDFFVFKDGSSYDKSICRAEVSQFFSVCGSGKKDKSVARLFERCRTLQSLETVCCPLAYRLGDKASTVEEDALVFENLAGFCIGLPHNSADDRRRLMNAVKEALTQLHTAGVVHMDFYLSNVMWRRRDVGTFDIRIIDLDGIHYIGERFSETMARRLTDLGFPSEWINNGASEKFDQAYVCLIEKNLDQSQLFWQTDQKATKVSSDDFIHAQAFFST